MIDNYEKMLNGLVKQSSFFDKKKKYDTRYIDERYNSYGELSRRMSFLRLGFLLGAIPETPSKILDIGYGNGDFLNCAKDFISDPAGFDVNGYPVPEGCRFVKDIYEERFDVVCFFDVLEHFEDIYEIRKLKTSYIYISVPECHYLSDEWFLNWKHRRPDEHLWHFNKSSLRKFMNELGYILITYSNVEDCIRTPDSNESNILTGIFKNDLDDNLNL
tara:strand:- start:31751 stop:32401 length:651 start_codon:yes stop_codon:yes gene_type:complete